MSFSSHDLRVVLSPSFTGPLGLTIPRHVLAFTMVVVGCPDAVSRGFACVNVGARLTGSDGLLAWVCIHNYIYVCIFFCAYKK